MKYKYDFLIQTDIGKLFGVSSHKIGKWLIDIGLRDENGSPSKKALDGNFVAILPCRNEKHFYSWHTQKTVEELEKSGYQKIPNPPEYLIWHDNLNGPYTYMRNYLNGYDIISVSTNTIHATVYGQQNAQKVTEAMNIYDRCIKRKINGITP